MKKILLTAAMLLTMMAISLNAQEKEWPNYARYAKSNKEILEAQANGAKKPLAVLMGDSITDGWYPTDKAFFEEHNLVGRGISGQCTSHMLARFQRDVVDLHPKYVVILAGINDIALNNGFSSKENALGNIISMCQIAKQNKIKVILCSTTPADRFSWRPEIKDVLEQSTWLNAAIKDYAAKNHIRFADYAAALCNDKGATDAKYSKDSVHPNLEGYKIMESVLLEALHIR